METRDELSEFVQFNEQLEETTNIILIWNRNRTLMFLELYKQYRKQVGSLKIRHLKKKYEIIARELELKLKIKVAPTHCENRWKVLERAYKKYIDNNKTTDHARRDFEYADIMDDILGRKKSINPTLVLASDTVDIIKNVQPGRNEIENNGTSSAEPAESDVPAKQRVICKKKQNFEYRTKLTKFEIIKEIRAERRQYYKQRLDLEEKKLEQKMEKNKLLEERNQLLKEYINKNVQICNISTDNL